MPAKSWDSFIPILYQVLDLIKPMAVIEWGPGKSTEILWNYPTVMKLVSVEHDPEFHKRLMGKYNENWRLHLETNLDEYAQYKDIWYPYDLAFVDGRNRARCLLEARKGILKPEGVAVLHDADRERYQDAIREFRHFIFTDEGNTAVMTNSKQTAKKIDWLSLKA
jgi:hypothetical protein